MIFLFYGFAIVYGFGNVVDENFMRRDGSTTLLVFGIAISNINNINFIGDYDFFYGVLN
jgi:hypothetical protein